MADGGRRNQGSCHPNFIDLQRIMLALQEWQQLGRFLGKGTLLLSLKTYQWYRPNNLSDTSDSQSKTFD